MHNELLYQIALTLVPNIGNVRAKALLQKIGSAKEIFNTKKNILETIEGIGTTAATAIHNFADFTLCEEEIKFIEKNKITPLFLTNNNYPKRLLHCYDSPTILYYKGNADLNTSKIISIVGTRNNTDYGKTICEKLIADLAQHPILIVSGLAFGIDSIAHKAALKNNLQTVGVVAHGLDKIYPPQNKLLATDMLTQGGLLTDFMSRTNPDRQNFPRRNKIVAAISDAIVVIESSAKGGSLITAQLGNNYNKDVFTIPGRITDNRSEGCNYLIQNNKATLITNATDMLQKLGWSSQAKKTKPQRELFIELTPNEKILTAILQANPQVHIDEINFKSGLSSSAIAQALLTLELQGIVTSLPGKMYKIQ